MPGASAIGPLASTLTRCLFVPLVRQRAGLVVIGRRLPRIAVARPGHRQSGIGRGEISVALTSGAAGESCPQPQRRRRRLIRRLAGAMRNPRSRTMPSASSRVARPSHGEPPGAIGVSGDSGGWNTSPIARRNTTRLASSFRTSRSLTRTTHTRSSLSGSERAGSHADARAAVIRFHVAGSSMLGAAIPPAPR